jgi:hypothetical protein
MYLLISESVIVLATVIGTVTKNKIIYKYSSVLLARNATINNKQLASLSWRYFSG